MPDRNQTILLQAQRLEHMGQLQETIQCIEQVLAMDPSSCEALRDLALVHTQNHSHDKALVYLNRALEINALDAQAYFERARVFSETGQHLVAIKNYHLSLLIHPSREQAHLETGLCYEQLQNTEQAIKSYDSALSCNPTFALAWYNKGNLLKSQLLHEEALSCYQRALGVAPELWPAWINLGLCFYALKQFNLAQKSYEHAIVLDCTNALAYYNKANALRSLGQLVLAEHNYDLALILNPRFAQALSNRGLTFKDRNLTERASQDFTAALTIDPTLIDAKWNLALLHLMKGEFALGWQGYEMRLHHPELKQHLGAQVFNAPLWDGSQSIQGKTLLVYCEQGLGDVVQFFRYLPIMTPLGAHVIFQIPAALKRLLAYLEPGIELREANNPTPKTHIDFYCALLSLPNALHNSLALVHIPEIYPLRLSPHYIEKWTRRLSTHLGTFPDSHNQCRYKSVGLVWRGNPNHKNDHNRSLPLTQLIAHLPEHTQFYVLQKDLTLAERALLNSMPNFTILSDELEDLCDTAAACIQMDLVISVDTSVAHLSATLGKETWVLLPFCADWRWLIHRKSSPWYPSVSLFRQETLHDWNGALANLCRELGT
jgi:tetratricopeptide (TPR) repeat protein